MDELQRILMNAGLTIENNEYGKPELSPKDAKNIMQLINDWLKYKQELANLKNTNPNDLNFTDMIQRSEHLSDSLGFISGEIHEYHMKYGFDTVERMFKHAKQLKGDSLPEAYENNSNDLIEQYQIFLKERHPELDMKETAGVGTLTHQNMTSDVGPNAIKKNAAKFGNKVTKGGIPPKISKDSIIKKN